MVLFSTFGTETLKEFRQAANMNSPITLYSLNQWKNFIKNTGFTLKLFESETRKIFTPNTMNLIKNLQQIGAAPIKNFNVGGLRKLIRYYDKHFPLNKESMQLGNFIIFLLLWNNSTSKKLEQVYSPLITKAKKNTFRVLV